MVITVASRTSTTVMRRNSPTDCVMATRTTSFVRTYSSNSHVSNSSSVRSSSARSISSRSVPRISYFQVSSVADTPSNLSNKSPLPTDLFIMSCPHCSRFSCQRRLAGQPDASVSCPNCNCKSLQVAKTHGGLVSMYRNAAVAHGQSPDSVAPLNQMLKLHYETSAPAVLFRGTLSRVASRTTTTTTTPSRSAAATPTAKRAITQKKPSMRTEVKPKSTGYQRKGSSTQ